MILYPPDHEGPTPNGKRGNEFEWTASQMKEGDVCWFRQRKNRGLSPLMTPWKRGTFLLSYYYDGVIARVYEDDPDDLIKHSLFLDLGDELRKDNPCHDGSISKTATAISTS